jgi:class 3 adenylate cyclase
MSQQIEKLAVLFADICGSTALYDNLGDELARRLIGQCITSMCDEIAAQQGTLIKTIGDEVMCTFPSSEQAFHAACAMQRAVEHGTYDGKHKMNVRIGFHYGDVIREAGDVYGDTVNVAARVASITRANQIMTTLAVSDNLPPALRARIRQVMRAEFKGKQEQFDIFLVIWELDDMMSTRIGIPAFRKHPLNTDELTLTYHDQTIHLNKDKRTVVLGREQGCEIIVPSDFASRQHARIELRSDKFVIVDQSTNGTYICSKEGDVCHINREEMILQGSGSISLGQPYSSNPTDLIEFSILSS